MRQLRDRARLAAEALERRGRRRVLRRQHLERELAARARRARPPRRRRSRPRRACARGGTACPAAPTDRSASVRAAIASLTGPAAGVSPGARPVAERCSRLAQQARELAARPRPARAARACASAARCARARRARRPRPRAPTRAASRAPARRATRARSARRGRSCVSFAMTSSSSFGAPHGSAMRGTRTLPAAASSRCRCGSVVRKRRPAQSSQSMMPERVEVDAPVADLLARDLGRDVAGLREDDAGDGVAAAVVAARGAEVDELHLARVADHHVLRRQVAVHDAERRAVGPGALVHVGERLGDLDRDRRRRPAQAISMPAWIARWRTSLRLRPSTYSTTVYGSPLVVGRRLEHLRDARVLQLRLHARLVEEAREERAVVDVVAAHRLDDARAARRPRCRSSRRGRRRPSRRARRA